MCRSLSCPVDTLSIPRSWSTACEALLDDTCHTLASTLQPASHQWHIVDNALSIISALPTANIRKIQGRCIYAEPFFHKFLIFFVHSRRLFVEIVYLCTRVSYGTRHFVCSISDTNCYLDKRTKGKTILVEAAPISAVFSIEYSRL